MIAPLHHRTTHCAERRIRSGLAHLHEGLPLLVGDLREVASPVELADTMLLRVGRGVRASHGAVIVGDAILAVRDVAPDVATRWLADRSPPADVSELVADRRDPLFPLRVPLDADGVERVGWLLLGPRPDSSFYRREERAVLRDIADPVARAPGVALARERRAAEARALDATRQAREDALTRSLDAMRGFLRERFGVELPGGAAT